MKDERLILTITAITEYTLNYRHPRFSAFKISELYDLSPEKSRSCATTPLHEWPAPYPSGNKAGVYLIFSDSLDLLYIGKASMGSCVGSRLGSYFKYGPEKRMALKHSTWSKAPRFFYVVEVPDDMAFEAAALEEYLIGRLHPLDNSVGRKPVVRATPIERFSDFQSPQ